MNNIESRKFWEKLDCVMLLVSPVCNAIHFIESNTAKASWVCVIFDAIKSDATEWTKSTTAKEFFTEDTRAKVLSTIEERYHGRVTASGAPNQIFVPMFSPNYLLAYYLDPFIRPDFISADDKRAIH